MERYRMARAFALAFITALASTLLASCAGTGPSVPDDETYRGQLAAALAPPAGAGWRSAEIQRRMLSGIEAADIFTNVIPLSSPRESNEAEVIIVPRVVELPASSGAVDRLALAVRANRKGSGAVGIDKVYRGRSSGRGDAIDDVLKALTKDLKRKYREPPVY
jgi:hypothetical protein